VHDLRAIGTLGPGGKGRHYDGNRDVHRSLRHHRIDAEALAHLLNSRAAYLLLNVV
jgi:hypothetical protein